MACGVGLCLSCVVPVKGKDSITRPARCCVDGPVFARRPGRLGADVSAVAVGRVDLTTMLADVMFTSPVMVASGCGGNGRELSQFCDLAERRGIRDAVGDARRYRPARPLPRTVETPSGLLSAVGLPGSRASTRSSPPTCPGCSGTTSVRSCRSPGRRWGSTPSWPVGSGNTPGVAGIEVNLSQGYARDAVHASRAVSVIRRDTATGVPVFAKLWPGVAPRRRPGGVGARRRAPTPSCCRGRFRAWPSTRRRCARAWAPSSGSSAVPRSGRSACSPCGRYAARCRMPASSASGESGTGADVLDYLAAGADAVQVGSAVFADPSTPSGWSTSCARTLASHGFENPRRAQRCGAPAGSSPRGGELSDGDVRSQAARGDARSRRTVRRDRPACRACSSDWGLDDDPAGLERFAMTCVEAFAARGRGRSSPSRRSSSGWASAGHRRAREARRRAARGRRAGAAGRQARRPGLDHAGLRRGVPRSESSPARRRRDHGQPLPGLRVPAAGAGHGVGESAGGVRAGAHVQPRGSAVPGARCRQAGRWPGRCWPPYEPRTPVRSAGLGRCGRRGHPRRAWTRTSTSAGRCSRPATASRAARPSTSERIFGDQLERVLPSTSRGVLRAGPGVAGLRAAVRGCLDELAGIRQT